MKYKDCGYSLLLDIIFSKLEQQLNILLLYPQLDVTTNSKSILLNLNIHFSTSLRVWVEIRKCEYFIYIYITSQIRNQRQL